MDNVINHLYNLELELFDKADKCAKKIVKDNPEYKKDIRYTTYDRLLSIIRSARLLLILKDQCIGDGKWWKSNHDKHFLYLDLHYNVYGNPILNQNTERYKKISNNLDQFIITGLYSLSFSVMESRFRIFYNFLFNAEEKGQIRRAGNISKLSQKLLDNFKFSEGLNACIKLFTKIRNTIHNNGVYSHENETILYKGKQFLKDNLHFFYKIYLLFF